MQYDNCNGDAYVDIDDAVFSFSVVSGSLYDQLEMMLVMLIMFSISSYFHLIISFFAYDGSVTH